MLGANPDYIVAVQSAAMVVSAICIISTIVWNVRVTRRRTTVDMLLAEQTNPILLEYRSKYLHAAKAQKLEELAEMDTYYYSNESFFLVSTLNRCDLVAIGIQEGIIDEKIYKAYWRASFVRDWIRCKGAVMKRRQVRGDPELFIDFEKLALRWYKKEDEVALH